jgi:alpha-beta hydrolase superfamily lysophospholipase
LLGLDPNGVSRDPEVVKDYLSDPLVYKGKISARLAAEMLDGMTNLTNHASTITLPLMVVHGSLDSLAAPQGGQLLVELVPSKDKIFDLREGLYHEVFNEPERDAVIAAVIARIAKTIS